MIMGHIDDEIIRTTMFDETPIEITDNEIKYKSWLEQFREEMIDESLHPTVHSSTVTRAKKLNNFGLVVKYSKS